MSTLNLHPKNGGQLIASLLKLIVLVVMLQIFHQANAATRTSIADADWDITTTWDCTCIPAATDDVVIATNVTIPNDNNTTVNDLTINANDTLILNDVDLIITGNWSNSGEFTHNNKEVIFQGSSAQTLSDTTTFYDLTIDNSSGVSISSGIQNVAGTLKLTAGVLTTTGQTLVLLSDSNATARIDGSGTGSITGDITIQRYVSGSEGWRFLSSPVSDTTINAHGDDYDLTGLIGSSDSAADPNVYYYDETQTGGKDTGWVALTNVTDTMEVGKGYICYIWSENLPLTLDVTGSPNCGNQSLSVSYTSGTSTDDDGWNFVGNPYPSTIDWDASTGWTKTNIDDAIYIWDPENQQYASYVASVGTNGGTQYIGSSQGFWVKANAASPVLDLTEDVKTSNDPTFFKTKALKTALSVAIEGNGYTDDAVVRFSTHASGQFDRSFDALKMFSGNTAVPSLYTMIDSSYYLSINAMPALNEDVSIPLYVYVLQGGAFRISANEIGEFDDNICIYLEDLETGSLTDLRNGGVHDFAMNPNPYSEDPRFMIHFTVAPTLAATEATCFGADDGIITISKASGSPWDFVIEDAGGHKVMHKKAVTGHQEITGLAAGTYRFTGYFAKGCQLQQEITIGEPDLIKASISAVSEVLLANGGQVGFLNHSKGASSYSWDFGDLSPGSTRFSPYHTYEYPGDFQVSLIASHGNCHDTAFHSISVLEASLVESLGESIYDSRYTLYPNPTADGKIRLLVSQLESEYARVNVYNLQGKIVYTDQLEVAANGMLRSELDLGRQVQKGTYILTISGDKDEIIKEKLIIL